MPTPAAAPTALLLRAARADLVFSSDFIVGFPGGDDGQHAVHQHRLGHTIDDDEFAIEAAVKTKEANPGSEVIVFAVGVDPPKSWVCASGSP